MSLDTLDGIYIIQQSVVRGNHVYKTVWTPFSLAVKHEIDDSCDSHTVAVYSEDLEFPCCSFL